MITAAPAPVVFGTKGLAGQVIDILIDNTLKHGDGAVTLMIDGPSVVVIDQGKGMTPEKLKIVFDGPVDPAAKHGRGRAGAPPRPGRRRGARRRRQPAAADPLPPGAVPTANRTDRPAGPTGAGGRNVGEKPAAALRRRES